MTVSWLTSNGTFIYVVSPSFVPMTRNSITLVGSADVCSYISTMYKEVPCLPNTPRALFSSHVVYHHVTALAVEHSAIVAQAALDIYNDANINHASYSHRVTIEQSFKDDGNKMVSRFGHPVNKAFDFVVKGKGNARSLAQSP